MQADPPGVPLLLYALHRLAEQKAAAISQDSVCPPQSKNSKNQQGLGLFLACGEFLEIQGEMKRSSPGCGPLIPATQGTKELGHKARLGHSITLRPA